MSDFTERVLTRRQANPQDPQANLTNPFSAGDVVRLNSGSPALTVSVTSSTDSAFDPVVTVVWMSQSGEIQRFDGLPASSVGLVPQAVEQHQGAPAVELVSCPRPDPEAEERVIAEEQRGALERIAELVNLPGGLSLTTDLVHVVERVMARGGAPM